MNFVLVVVEESINIVVVKVYKMKNKKVRFSINE
jgi:hypothetical protein